MDCEQQQTDARILSNLQRPILIELNAFFHDENTYVKEIKAARNSMLQHQNDGVAKKGELLYGLNGDSQVSTLGDIMRRNRPKSRYLWKTKRLRIVIS